MMPKQKIAIIGSNGYIGQHLVSKLSLDSFKELFLYDIQEKSVFSEHPYQKLDIRNDIPNSIKTTLLKVDFLYFFSGLTGTLNSISRYEEFVKINELGLLKILDLIKDSKHKPKIIFPSTRLVYKGVNNTLLKEEADKELKTIYAVNKLACEHYLSVYSNLFGITYSIFRICVPYGNLLNNSLSYGTLSHFINKAKADSNIILYGDGSLKRTFTHIDDLTELLVKGGLSEKTNNDVFNIGSNDHLSLSEVANTIAQLYNVQVEYIPFPENDIKIESGDTIFDSSKLNTLLEYQYKNSFTSWINYISLI